MKKGTTGHGPRAQQQPDGSVRASQMVTTYGPGSMVDLLHDAVLVGGLDFWSYPKDYAVPTIDEPRLRDAIVRQFSGRAESGAPRIELSTEAPFRAPPVGNDREPTKFAGVAVAEFPRWFVCQNPSCRQLLQARDGLEFKSHRYWHQCTNKKPSECVPVRFVEACRRGHLDDFRWIPFVHDLQNKERCASPKLTFEEGASGDFDDIVIRCACGLSAKLRTALSGMRMTCHGSRPWLGREGRESCDENVRLLVRTASNSYFSQSMSALSIPDPTKVLIDKVRSQWSVLKGADATSLPMLRTVVEVVRNAIEGFSDGAVLDAIRAIHQDKSAESDPIRTAEFKQFVSAKPEAIGELPSDEDVFFARSVVANEPWPAGVRNVVLASKLREVIAQIGFTRLEPVTPDVQGEYDLDVSTAALGLTTNWLPASEIHGEGVFIELDEARVREWESRPEVIARGLQLANAYEQWSEGVESAPAFPGVRFYLLHSLSHLLISAISLECGYAASALRERIYSGPSERDPHTPMAAILLSTGTTGTEGTLGGLVEQGRSLRTHLQRAWDLGQLCSNDPVCGSHNPEGDHAERYLEGAACHGCLFIAECSCERFNRYLDRALVVPTLGHPATLAFWSERP
ncbi:MAG: DrmB family protein [Polyangiales bacterium]